MSDTLLTGSAPATPADGQTPAANAGAAHQPNPNDGQQAAANQPKNGEGAGGQKAPEQKPVVPEKYDLKLPEGSQLDAKHLETVAAYARELGLNQEQAAKLVERDNALVAGKLDAVRQQWAEQTNKWVDQIKADKEIGGANFDATVTSARKAIDKFGSPAFKQALNDSGFGNHPELVRVFAQIGRALSEDKILNGGQSASKPRDAAMILYGSAE